jgi:general secretion pathway protein G
MRRKNVRGKRAFTLIELLLVAGILALLAAFAIPRLMGQAEQARISLAEAAVGRNGPISKALDAYRWDMGKYPETDEGLAALMQPKSRVDDERYGGPYLENDKVEDAWGNAFNYRAPGEFHEDSFDLWSSGPDGKDDEGKEGSDDIKNWVES